MNPICEGVMRRLSDAGYACAIVGVERLQDLRHDLEGWLDSGMMDREFYEEVVDRYDLDWDFEPPSVLPGATSIFIIAAPQPKVRVTFRMAGESKETIIPSTYNHDVDSELMGIVSAFLEPYDLRVCEALLPEKLLAVRSGLACYGRNNVAYVDGLGSYVRLRAFFSDLPCPEDSWREPAMMEACVNCSACRKRCPTGTIVSDRVLIHAEKCLTFFNEGLHQFPEWIDPSWHHCLIGCLRCQDVCPVNQEFVGWIDEGEVFSEEEATLILRGASKTDLPEEMVEKLGRLYMLRDFDLLRRNLSVLMSNG